MRFHLKTHKAKAQAAEYILNLPEMPVMECEVKEYKRQRSPEQNRRYWAILEQIAYWKKQEGIDHRKESWHEYFKQKFIEPEVTIIYNMIIADYTSSDKGTFLFSEFSAEVEAWAANEKITILDADQWREFRKNA